jgi:hypothetical protein
VRRLALLATVNDAAQVALVQSGWEVQEGEGVRLDSFAQARFDLVVCEVHASDFALDLRRISTIKAAAPDLPMVVIAPDLHGPKGENLVEALVDVPIIRSGAERRLLPTAVAAAL